MANIDQKALVDETSLSMCPLEDDVRVANVEETQRRLGACYDAAQSGKLIVLADFDRTVTRCFLPDGSRGTSAHGVLEANQLSEAFTEKAKELLAKYHPVEIDANLSITEKIPIMNEWYGQVHALLLKENLTKSAIAQAVADCKSIQLREGMLDLLRSCQDATPPIPFLIMSAGLGDVIDEFLRQHVPFELAPSTMVVSNQMQFDDEGCLVSFSEPLLHMFNKSAAFLPDKARQLVAGHDCCLLLGDGIGDLTMAEGLTLQELRVGFLNEKIEERLQQYLDGFDAVVTDDGRVPRICFRALGSSAME